MLRAEPADGADADLLADLQVLPVVVLVILVVQQVFLGLGRGRGVQALHAEHLAAADLRMSEGGREEGISGFGAISYKICTSYAEQSLSINYFKTIRNAISRIS